VTGVVLWGAFPVAYAALFLALDLPLLFMLGGLNPARRRFEFRNKTERDGCGPPYSSVLGFESGESNLCSR
jgi:cytochrome bd-type quinol oxidase subunit 2